MGRYGGRGRVHHKCTLESEQMSLSLWLQNIFYMSIVLRSCSGTALVWITFGWSNLDSLFSHPIFLSNFYFWKTCKNELWMVVDLEMFLFSSHFPFQISFQKPARIKIGWVDVEEGAGPTTNTCIIPSILANFRSVHGSRLYSVYSFGQLSWHSTGENDFWMVDVEFFSSHFPFTVVQKPAKIKFGWQIVDHNLSRHIFLS